MYIYAGIPDPPSGLQVVPICKNSTIQISWNKSSVLERLPKPIRYNVCVEKDCQDVGSKLSTIKKISSEDGAWNPRNVCIHAENDCGESEAYCENICFRKGTRASLPM